MGVGNVDDLSLAPFLVRHPGGYKDVRMRVGDLNQQKGGTAHTVCQFPSPEEEIILESMLQQLSHFTVFKAYSR